MEVKPKFLGPKYIPEYGKDYFELPWYGRDLMRHYKHLDCKDMADNRDHYFKCKKVINVGFIHHQCRADPLNKSEKEHNTVVKEDFEKYLEREKEKTLAAVFCNKRDDLWVRRNLMIEHFFKKINFDLL